MATIYTWTIDSMFCIPQEDGKTNIVTDVIWTLTGNDGEFTANESGGVGLTYDPTKNYTPYNELTQDQVIQWAQSIMGEELIGYYKGLIEKKLYDLKYPPLVNPPLPWNPTTAVGS